MVEAGNNIAVHYDPDPKAPELATGKNASPPEALAARAGAARLAGQQLGDAILLMLTAPRYRHISLSDLDWMVLPPLLANQLIVAHNTPTEQRPIAAPVGVAIWARVSPDVDLKIKQQIANNVFPIRLKPDEWTSGDAVWLMDVIAPTRVLATKLFREFQRLKVGDGRLQINPIVGRVIDVKLLKKLDETG
jgi:cytolysin-activating lysine-acyltransferase